MKAVTTTVVLLALGLGQVTFADTGSRNQNAQVPSVPGTYGPRTGEPVLLIRDFLPWGGDIVPFFTAAGTVVTVITSDMITSETLSDYCMVAVTAGTTGYYDTIYQDNVNAAVGLFTTYVQGGGVMLYQTGTWGGSIILPGGVSTVLNYDNYNYFTGPHYLATGMPYPMFDGNYASHDDLLNLPGTANIIATGTWGQATCAEWTIGSGAVLAMTQPTECYIPGGYCYGIAPHFNQFQSNCIEYARSLGDCGAPIPFAQLSPTVAVNCLGDPHTVTVTITDDNNQPVVGQDVVIDVVLGPNNGLSSGTLTTDTFGQASFTFTSYVAGTDLLVASFFDAAGLQFFSNTARKIWEECNVDANETAQSFVLGQNYPNPFNPTTTISFTLPETAVAKLTVHNLAGDVVATLVNGMTERGEHQVTFNAENLSSGLYLYRLESMGQVQSGRMLLVK
jgi:hypothetical protein